MATVERICPKCGTTNAGDRVRCKKCGTALGNLPVPGEKNLAAGRDRTGTAGLVLTATALVARAGFRLFRQEILPRLAKELTKRPSNTIIDQAPRRPEADKPGRWTSAEDQAPDYTIRGWRTWSVRRGSDESSGSESFEWKVSRRRDGGAGKE